MRILWVLLDSGGKKTTAFIFSHRICLCLSSTAVQYHCNPSSLLLPLRQNVQWRNWHTNSQHILIIPCSELTPEQLVERDPWVPQKSPKQYETKGAVEQGWWMQRLVFWQVWAVLLKAKQGSASTFTFPWPLNSATWRSHRRKKDKRMSGSERVSMV